jgi:hypothetical protein
MEVARSDDALTDQPGADHKSVLLDEGAVGPLWEGDLRYARDRERVRDPGQHCEEQEGDEGGQELAPHHDTPRALIARSISLMPAKGATSPPSP